MWKDIFNLEMRNNKQTSMMLGPRALKTRAQRRAPPRAAAGAAARSPAPKPEALAAVARRDMHVIERGAGAARARRCERAERCACASARAHRGPEVLHFVHFKRDATIRIGAF